MDGACVTKSAAFEFVSVPFPQVLPGFLRIESFAAGAAATAFSGHVPVPYPTLSTMRASVHDVTPVPVLTKKTLFPAAGNVNAELS